MNERIKELVGQAKFMAEETINKKISKNAELDAFAEKFAQLIVQECAELFPERHYHYSGLAVKRNIKKHFGVEE
jgi:hypothetical protein